MSSPTTPLSQTWSGTLGGLFVSGSYDASTRSVKTIAKNTLQQKLCYVQTEPHLKLGSGTVGELGPGVMGTLTPGQIKTSRLFVADEPELKSVVFDGYVIHLEVFDCGGPGPQPHSSNEGSEGSGESHGSEDNEGSGESHGSGDRG